jgi:hypothetical protein
MATVSSEIRRKSTGDFVVGLVDFGEVPLTEKVCETEDVVLDFFACWLVLARVHSGFEGCIPGI